MPKRETGKRGEIQTQFDRYLKMRSALLQRGLQALRLVFGEKSQRRLSAKYGQGDHGHSLDSKHLKGKHAERANLIAYFENAIEWTTEIERDVEKRTQLDNAYRSYLGGLIEVQDYAQFINFFDETRSAYLAVFLMRMHASLTLIELIRRSTAVEVEWIRLSIDKLVELLRSRRTALKKADTPLSGFDLRGQIETISFSRPQIVLDFLEELTCSIYSEVAVDNLSPREISMFIKYLNILGEKLPEAKKQLDTEFPIGRGRHE